jgi:riboflavin kinase / FMN adenylyltransferase
MKLFRSLGEVPAGFGPSAVTIGNFDGLHAAHRRILRRVVAVAAERGLRPSVLTFHPHPASVVAPERAPRLMTTPEQRARLMESEGIEQVLILPFTAEFSELSPEEFVERVIVERLGAKAVLVGHNFHFGRGQAGNVERLKQLGERFGFETEVVPAVRCRGLVVSSSELRRLIGEGDVTVAWRLLERPYSVEGAVVSGRGIGSKQTVPTLNVATDSQVIPATGVYVTRTCDSADGRQWRSVTNVGYRPTFGASEQLTIETFLLDRLDGAPPSRIRVDFLYRLREERAFPSPEALKAQILRDVARAQKWFRRSGK